MATTLHEPAQIDLNNMSGVGNGGSINIPAEGGLRATLDHSRPTSSSAIWVAMFAISMMFAAFTSALIVRKGSSMDWQSFTLPSILYFNTFLLLLSSVTLEIARRRVDAFMKGSRSSAVRPTRWLYITLSLGLLFVIGQYIAWQQLRAEGMYLATNPSSSFFYVLTATHALHVLGGLGGLIYVISKLHQLTLRRNTIVATARYWHFMGALWVYLMLLLWIKL
jgi:cytochrome c oxidase subunit 3